MFSLIHIFEAEIINIIENKENNLLFVQYGDFLTIYKLIKNPL